MPVQSQAKFTVSGSAQYESQSNIYDLPAGTPLPGTTDTRQGDDVATYNGKFETSYLWRQDDFFVNLSGSELRYDRLTYLDHSEYAFDGGLNWALDGRILTGGIDIGRSRSAVPFYTLIQVQEPLVLSTQQHESANVSYLAAPEWRIGADVHKTNTDAPVASNTGLSNSEYGGGVQLTYLATGRLTGGIAASYSRGGYGGVNAAAAAPYTQETISLTSTYTVTARTAFSGQLGYSRRTSDSDIDNTSGLSGGLNYRRTLTPKTSIYLYGNRSVASNITNVGSELDTSGGGGLTYTPTYRTTLNAGYNVTLRFLPGQGSLVGTDRTDRVQIASVDMSYQWLHWLSLRAYANYQTRASDNPGVNFNATTYGIAATATWSRP